VRASPALAKDIRAPPVKSGPRSYLGEKFTHFFAQDFALLQQAELDARGRQPSPRQSYDLD
jgi:hypothetical protein